MKFARVLAVAGALTGIGLFGIAAAQQGGAAPAAPAAAQPLAPGAFKVDGGHSAVIFKIKHNNVTNFYGRFNNLSGAWNLDAAAPDKSAMEFSIKTDSVDTGNSKRDDHLKSPDFFNAKENPTMTFKSTKVTKKDDTHYEVTGDLTLMGKTKPVTVAIEHTGTATGERGTRSGIEAVFTIKRSDYGVGSAGPGLGDEVTVIAGVEGNQAK